MPIMKRSLSLRPLARPCSRPLPRGSLTRIQQTTTRPFSISLHRDARIIVKVPPMAESINEGTLASLNKKVGEEVEADDDIANIETDKVDVPVNAPEAGVITEIFVAEGDVVTVGQDIAVLETEGGDAEAEAAKPPPVEEPKQSEPPKEPEASIPVTQSVPVPPTESTAPSSKAPQKGEREVRASRMRLAIARNLKESQNTAASATTYQDIDMTNLLAWRNKHRQHVQDAHGVRLGYMGAFTKATVLAAAAVPEITATLNLEKKTITYRDFTNVGIAVSTDRGLVTPVVRDAQERSVVELEKEVAHLAAKARDSKLVMEDLEGGHFSISNPGIFGSLYGTPIIPLGQMAVFNLNSIRERVVPVDGEVKIRPIMIISLSYDHRLMDGLEALKFLNHVKKYIQEPELLGLE